MGKKILILGVGAQGSTVAQRMDEEPNVEKIICADYDAKAVSGVVAGLNKGVGATVDASDKGSIVNVANGVDLIVNGLPLRWHGNVLDAALEVGADYQDFAATDALAPPLDDGENDWIGSIKILYEEYGPKFKAAGHLAIIGTGSAPGLICAATRRAVRELDTCDTIYNIVYEGVEAKRFLPFWWSPITALNDMSEEAYAAVDGKLVRTPAFGLPIVREYDYMGTGPVTLGEHCHDEPVHYWFNRDTHFKGVRNAWFKYGGAGFDFAKPLYRAGLLSHKQEEVDGVSVSPFSVVLKHLPPAPKYHEEIKEILDEGLVSDTGCMVIEAYGKKNGEDILVETHVYAPGLADSFERSGLTAEMYLTGQGGALFTKMFVNDVYDQAGLISSDMITEEQVDHYFEEAAKLGITLETKIKKKDEWPES
ncbi:MAG: saccharopine dehydrogenase NADP-binding domain-containing protein [Clostridiales Family XIII bacterium]|jgi:saccharopine dehydrogenase-like NADP-dependent oxidoreductase|nr:saccharopine dehydrogenase NADP-binding domain-containing protein [Clostridiales Family XIII bacterium]